MVVVDFAYRVTSYPVASVLVFSAQRWIFALHKRLHSIAEQQKHIPLAIKCKESPLTETDAARNSFMMMASYLELMYILGI